MFVASIVIFFYFWTFFTSSRDTGLSISVWSVFVSAFAFLVGVVSYLWAPQNRIREVSFVVYLVLAATAATLIITGGGISSPFVALWMLVAVFAGIFGVWAMFISLLAGSSYLVIAAVSSNLDEQTIMTTILAAWLPIVASYIIWHSKGSHATSSDKAYHELASELSEVASKAEVVINAIADGVIAVDNKGTIQLINPAAQQITGWGKQDAITLSYKSILKLTDSKDQEVTTANDPVYQVLETNKEVETDSLSLTTHSGKKLLVSIVVSPIAQLGSGAIVVFRDITSEKKEEREQAEFISTASHEMRTPVASIEGYLGLVLNPATAQIDDKARDFITKAHEAAQHLGRLFQDLLDVSKAEDGRLSNNPKIVDVVEFAATIVEGLRPQADAKQLRLVYKPMADDATGDARRLGPVFYTNVDNDHLREVIANLTENAIKYTPKGDVIVDVTGDTEHVEITVADSGIGIPAEDIPHLFQKFYRVDNTDTRTIGGTGLGLYLCRRLTDIMGGRIWVESQLGRGSTFHLELPRTDHEDATRLIEAASLQQETPEIMSDTAQPKQDITATPQVSVASSQASSPQTLVHSAPLTPEPAVGSTVTSPDPQVVAKHLRTATSPQPQPATQRSNTPLSSIEANPTQFTQPRQQAINVPVREQKP